MTNLVKFIIFVLAGMFWIFASMVADTWPLNLDMKHGTWVIISWFLGALLMTVATDVK